MFVSNVKTAEAIEPRNIHFLNSANLNRKALANLRMIKRVTFKVQIWKKKFNKRRGGGALKESFHEKMKRGYRLTAKNKSF